MRSFEILCIICFVCQLKELGGKQLIMQYVLTVFCFGSVVVSFMNHVAVFLGVSVETAFSFAVGVRIM